MKKTLHLVHKFIALGAGVFIVSICLAGALLAFRDSLAPIVTPALMVQAVTPTAGHYGRVLAAARSVAQANQSIEIRMHPRPDRAAFVALHGGAARTLYVNSYSGAIVADSAADWLPFDVLFRLHRTLLAGDAGEYLVATVGAALTIMCLTGLVLWWPRQWRQALRIRWEGNRMAVSFDLHKALGATVAVLLLFNALTGVVLIFSGASTRIVNFAAGTPAIEPPAMPACVAPEPPKDLDELVRTAGEAFPAGVVTQVMVGSNGRPLIVRKRTAAEHNPLGSNRIYVDPCRGTALKVVALEKLPPGSAMYEWLYSFHIGELFGSLHKLVLTFAGLAPSVLLVTGLIVWWTRSQMRKKTPARKGKQASE